MRTTTKIDEIYDGKGHYAEVLITTYLKKNTIQKAILDFSTCRLGPDENNHINHNFFIEGEIIDMYGNNGEWYNNRGKLLLKAPALTFAKACKLVHIDIRSCTKKYEMEFKVVSKRMIKIMNKKEVM